MYLLDNRLFKVEKTLSFLFFSFRMCMFVWWENLNHVHSLTWIAHRHLRVTKSDRNCSMYCAYIIIIILLIIIQQFQVQIRHAHEMPMLCTIFKKKRKEKNSIYSSFSILWKRYLKRTNAYNIKKKEDKM